MKTLLLATLASLLFSATACADSTATAFPSQGITLSLVACDGTPPFTYQWQKDGVPIPGASGTVTANPTDAAPQAIYTMPKGSVVPGVYTCVVTNPGGSTTSDAAVIKIGVPPAGAKAKGNAN